MSQKQKIRFEGQDSRIVMHRRKIGTRAKIIGGVVAVLIIVGGLGIFALVRQHSAATPSTFSISISGGIQGSLAINTVNACGVNESSAGYEIDASGTINEKVYEFLLIIPTYQQPGTYSTTGSGAIATVTLTEIQLGSQAWVSQGSAGSVVVQNDSHSGTISTTLVSVATNARAQIVGTWVCA